VCDKGVSIGEGYGCVDLGVKYVCVCVCVCVCVREREREREREKPNKQTDRHRLNAVGLNSPRVLSH
jgi:hypothetical protein